MVLYINVLSDILNLVDLEVIILVVIVVGGVHVVNYCLVWHVIGGRCS